MSVLQNHLRKENESIRWQEKDLILYKPTDSQNVEIQKIISDSTRIENDEAIAEYGENIIMYFIRELTNIGEEVNDYSYEELITIYDIDSLISEIVNLIEEMTNEIIEKNIKEIKLVNRMLKVFELNLSAEETQIRFNKLLKKQGVNLTVEQMVEYKDNPEKIIELINKPKRKNNKKK